MPDVFISYARADRKHVRLIALALQKEGFSVWWDPKIKPGKKWNDSIRRALAGADCVVTCWSPTSARSDWVAAESHHAYATGLLVPVMLKACTPPLPFNVIQAADLTTWRGDPDDDEWVATLERVRAVVEGKRRPPVAAPSPGEAQAAMRLATAAGAAATATSAAQAEPPPAEYRLSKSRGRMKPRASRFLVAAVVVGVLITGGLWAAETYAPGGLQAIVNRVSPTAPAQAPAPASPVDVPPPIEATPLPPPSAPDAQRLDTPQAPANVGPFTQTSAAPPQTAPTQNPTGYPGQLDACATRLVLACPAAAGRMPMGFRNNAAVDPAERRFFVTLGASVDPVDAASVRVCQSALRASTPSTAFQAACRTLIYPPSPGYATPPPTQPPTRTPTTTATPTAPPPSTGQTANPQRGITDDLASAIIQQLPNILAQQRQNADASTQQQTPQRPPATNTTTQTQSQTPQRPPATNTTTQTQSQTPSRTSLPALPDVQFSLQTVEAQIDRCLNQLARYCPNQPTGFANDGTLSSRERQLLSSPSLFQSPGAVTRSNFTTCEAHLQAAQRPATTGAARTYLPLATACTSLAPPPVLR